MELEDLNKIIKRINTEENSYEDYKNRLVRIGNLKKEFNNLITKWKNWIAEGKLIKIEIIENILNSEISNLKLNGIRRKPKLYNNLEIFHEFSEALNILKFEIALKEKAQNLSQCNCDIRIKYRIEPKKSLLTSYGIAYLYDPNIEYTVYNCRCCQKKWIEEDQGGGGLRILKWVEWNPKNYILKYKIE